VEGNGYIRKLTQGFPHRKQGLAAAVESVHDEPRLLSSTAGHTLVVSNVSMAAGARPVGRSGGGGGHGRHRHYFRRLSLYFVWK
jgi:hypothetical protein